MTDHETDEKEPSGRGRPPLIYQEITLETYEDARALYQRVTRDYGTGKLTRERARNLGYLLTGLLAFHRMDLDQELLRRIEKIEAALAERPKR